MMRVNLPTNTMGVVEAKKGDAVIQQGEIEKWKSEGNKRKEASMVLSKQYLCS